MASYNRVILMGNLTRDIELRYTQSGMAVADIGLAVNERRKNAAGEWVDEAHFFDVTMFGRTAEIAAEYLSKGSPLFVEGKLRYETWEKDGVKRSKVSVICDRMQLLGGGGGPGGGSSGGGGRERAPAQRGPNASPGRPQQVQQDEEVYEDEGDHIPF